MTAARIWLRLSTTARRLPLGDSAADRGSLGVIGRKPGASLEKEQWQHVPPELRKLPSPLLGTSKCTRVREHSRPIEVVEFWKIAPERFRRRGGPDYVDDKTPLPHTCGSESKRRRREHSSHRHCSWLPGYGFTGPERYE